MSTKTEPALQLERMSNLIEAATIDEYETILREKKRILEKEQEELTASMTLLDKELGRTEQMRRIHKKGHGGVPLSSVSLLTCPVPAAIRPGSGTALSAPDTCMRGIMIPRISSGNYITIPEENGKSACRKAPTMPFWG